MKKTYLFIAFMFTFSVVSAQTTYYTFSTNTETYQELDNPIILTDPDETWDDPELTIPFNFPFQLFGEPITNLYTNFGLGTDLYNSNDENVVSASMLSPILFDIVDRGYLTGISLSSIGYQITGNTGSRILKVQWKNVGSLDDLDVNESSTDFFNFQVWFYETSNKIEMHYGSSFIADPTLYFDYTILLIKTVGFQNDAIEDIHYLTGSPSNPLMNVSSDIEQALDNDLNGFPPANTVYIFNPIGNGNTNNLISIDPLVLVQMYPNPTSSKITLTSEAKITSVKIIDLSNRVFIVESTDFSTILLDNLDAGNYFLEIQTEKGIVTNKITKL